MKNKWVYISLSLVGALGIYFLATKLFKKDDESTTDEEIEEEDPTKEQIKQDPTLIEALKSGKAIGMKVYTKVNNANIRNSAEVNNGYVNNIWANVSEKGTYLGTIYDIYKSTDTNLINPNTNQPYYWVVLHLDQTLWQKLVDAMPWYDPDKESKIRKPVKLNERGLKYFMREDTIKL